jgi:hypothetical protein
MLVANNAGAWYAALDRLVRDPPARSALANRSRTAFLAQATLASRGVAWRNACMDLLKIRRDHAA